MIYFNDRCLSPQYDFYFLNIYFFKGSYEIQMSSDYSILKTKADRSYLD